MRPRTKKADVQTAPLLPAETTAAAAPTMVRWAAPELGASRVEAQQPQQPSVDRLQAPEVESGAEEELDRSLRPRLLTDFVGQEQVKEQLGVFIEAARGRGEALDHVLLAGPPGLGKTSLAQIVANELGVEIVPCHLGQLEIGGGEVRLDGRHVDVVYRVFMIEDLLDPETRARLERIRRGNA